MFSIRFSPHFIFLTLALYFIGSPFSLATLPPKPLPNFNAAKKEARLIYAQNRQTFFCAIPFDEKGKVNLSLCTHCPKKTVNIQWMPVVPIPLLAKNLLCFKENICKDKKRGFYKGIQCCRQKNRQFNIMEADLHNLVPEIAFFKSQRRDYAFDDIPSSSSSSKCHFVIDTQNKIVSPDPQLRGIIARAYLYMHDTYPLALPPKEIALYRKWHQQYPPSDWEKRRNEKIQHIQGNRNPYIN